MGAITNKEKFVKISISLKDLFSGDEDAVRFALTSLGVYHLRRKAPKIAEQIKDPQGAYKYYYDGEDLAICVGKTGYGEEEIEAAINAYLERVQ
jgi:hypothetical protein